MSLTKTPICDFGKKAETFQLNSTENKIISLEDVRGENGVLVMFICNHCPYVKAVIEDIVKDCNNLEKNTSIWFNATLRGDIENIYIGEGSNVQDGSVLHTDPGFPLKVGKNVTIGHLVMLHGCSIGDNSLIGIGAVILNNVKIGKNCIIGAKALITENKEISDNSLVVGSPGKIIRKVSNEEAKLITKNANRYQDNWKKYSKSIF